MLEFHPIQLNDLVDRALSEDWAHGDWTTDACVDQTVIAEADIVAKSDLTVAGTDIVSAVFSRVDPELHLNWKVQSGEQAAKGTVLLHIHGKARSILKAERVALNFFARLCGIATHTFAMVQALEGTDVRLLDTRKTTPGLRVLEKSAVVAGGGRSHRWCLMDGVLIKENHIRAAGGIAAAFEKLGKVLPPHLKIEVETTCQKEVEEAVQAGADIIMLDNMSLEEMRYAVQWIDKRAKVEASGNVTLETIRDIAETGVDYISTSAMFHSSKWSDLSLLVKS